MPTLTPFVNEVPMPGAPALPRFDVEAAGQTAEALARGTAGVSDEMAGLAQRYAEQKRAIAASDTMIGLDTQLGEAATRWSRVPDMQAAVAGFNDEATQLRQQAVSPIGDPTVQAMVAQRFDEARLVHSNSVRTGSFGLEAAAARGSLDTQLAGLAQTAATAPTPEARAQAVDDAGRAIAARSPLYLAPDEAARTGIQFRSNVQKVQALDFIQRASKSPDITRLSPLAISDAILDPQNFQGLLPTDREEIAGQAIRLGRTITAMRMSDQAHSDAVAERELRQTQSGNAATLIAQTANAAPGAAPAGADALAELVRTQQLSEAGFAAVLAAQSRRDAGRDDPAVATDLYRRAAAGENVTDDALGAYAAGHLSRDTVTALQKAVDAKGAAQETAVDRANFNTLKTALNGYAIEQGVFAGQDRQEKAQLWTQAQTEWTRRVLGGGEGSGAVLSDMLARYVKHPDAPEGLPQPRLGAVGSLQDVAQVWARTKAAHDSGALADGAFEAETQLLEKYRSAYAAAQAQAQAARPVRPGAPRAQPAGLTPDLTAAGTP